MYNIFHISFQNTYLTQNFYGAEAYLRGPYQTSMMELFYSFFLDTLRWEKVILILNLFKYYNS